MSQTSTARRRAAARVILVGFLLLGASAAGAQQGSTHANLAGEVHDEFGRAVPGATARLVEIHREQLTHPDGRFHFEAVPLGSYTLTVRAVGYRPFTQRVTVDPSPAPLFVNLSKTAVQIEELVVTGTLDPRSRDEVLSPTSVLSGAELDRRVGQTVGASLQGLPGVSVGSLGPTTARPVIRGLSGDRILVVEDGLRPGDLSAMTADHAVAIDPIAAEQIEVVRGPMSLLYGSSALGGVVNVIRNEIPLAVPPHTTGSAAVGVSSVNRGANGGGTITTGMGAWAARIEGSLLGVGDVHTPIGRISGTDATTWAVGASLALVDEHSHAGVAYRFYSNDYGVPGGFVGGHQTPVQITMRRHTARIGGELHREIGLISGVRADLQFTDYHHDETEPSGALGTSFDQQIAVADLVARHGAQGILAQGAAGLRGQYRDVATGGTLKTPSTYDVSLAGFVVEELGQDAFRLQVGGRYDYAHYVPREITSISVGGKLVPVRPRTFGAVSGSVGLLYAFSPAIRAGASASRAYRTPDFNELYSNGPHLADNSFNVGDPNLQQETGFGLDAWLRLTTDRIQAEIAVFRNQLSDFIFPSSRGRAELGSQGGRPRFQYTNEDARFQGVEGQVSLGLTSRLALDATASVVYARFTAFRDSIPVITPADTTFIAASDFPPFIPPLNGRVELRYETPSWFLTAGTRYAGRQDRTGDFEVSTDGYVLANASAGVRFQAGGFFHAVTLRGENLTNREYRDHLSRLKEILPEPGTNISLLYRLSF